MVRKSGSCQLVFEYIPAGQNSVGSTKHIVFTYVINEDDYQGCLTCADIEGYFSDFIDRFGLSRAMQLTYTTLGLQKKVIGPDFELTFQEWVQGYDGKLLIMVRSQVGVMAERLDELNQYVDKLFDELEIAKKGF